MKRKLKFAPLQLNDYLTIHFVDSHEEARKIIPEWQDDYKGLCEYNYDSGQSYEKAKIIILNSCFSLPLVIHELTHAATCWLESESLMLAEETMNPEELNDYYKEAIARCIENLTREFLKCTGLIYKTAELINLIKPDVIVDDELFDYTIGHCFSENDSITIQNILETKNN